MQKGYPGACGALAEPEALGDFRMSQTIAPAAYLLSALPPGPRAPAWWQLVRFAGDPLGVLDECHAEFGDAFTLRLAGHGKFVMLSDPEVVREVFRGDPEVLHSGEANSIFIATVGRNSVLVLSPTRVPT